MILASIIIITIRDTHQTDSSAMLRQPRVFTERQKSCNLSKKKRKSHIISGWGFFFNRRDNFEYPLCETPVCKRRWHFLTNVLRCRLFSSAVLLVIFIACSPKRSFLCRGLSTDRGRRGNGECVCLWGRAGSVLSDSDSNPPSDDTHRVWTYVLYTNRNVRIMKEHLTFSST